MQKQGQSTYSGNGNVSSSLVNGDKSRDRLQQSLADEIFMYRSTMQPYCPLAFCISAKLSFKASIALSISPLLSFITLTPI